MSSKITSLVAVSLLFLAAPARADDVPAPAPVLPPPPAPAAAAAQIRESARQYYADETTASWLFVGYGAVHAGVGAVSLAQSGDFAKSFGWSSVVGGGLTAVGGLGYLVAVKLRGDYFKGLADTDLARFELEEGEHVGGTRKHFFLYLGFEIVETLAGIGIATYGLAAKNDIAKGIGMGTALQGIGLFVIDVPGAGRAAKYDDEVRAFNPQLGFAIGSGTRPWATTLTQTF